MSKLQYKRKESGMSQNELAKKTGVNVRLIQDYEQGHKSINGAAAITVYRLAIALGCGVSDLLEFEAEAN